MYLEEFYKLLISIILLSSMVWMLYTNFRNNKNMKSYSHIGEICVSNFTVQVYKPLRISLTINMLEI